jgi:hypothetical protein
VNRHRPAPRSLVMGPAETRAAWKAWLAAARARAGAAMAGAPYDKVEEICLAQGVLRTSQRPFPAADAPARGMAGAFHQLSKTFLETTGAERRAAMAPALERLAWALEEILEEPTRAAFAQSCSVLGERD